MKPFIVFKEIDSNGELKHYVLQRDFPHYLGVILEYPRQEAIVKSAVSGYNLWVCFAGTLRGNFIPNYPEVLVEKQRVFDIMANWFYTNCVMPEEKKYKRFKIKDNATIS